MNGWRLRLFVGVERLLARLGLKLPGKIMYIGGSDTLPPPLSRDEEAELIARLDGGDEGVKSQLIERNLRLVVYIARRFENTGVGIEDLISIGTIGLIKGISTFDASKGARLATYAARCVENEILMYFRSQKKTASDVSLSECIETGKDGTSLSLMDVIDSEEDLFEDLSAREMHGKLREIMQQVLTPREREILTLRYGLSNQPPQTQRELAARCGISRSYVSRIEKKALKKLEDALSPFRPDD